MAILTYLNNANFAGFFGIDWHFCLIRTNKLLQAIMYGIELENAVNAKKNKICCLTPRILRSFEEKKVQTQKNKY